MARVYYDRDADLDVLSEKTIAIIGYGSQGHAQAQNLKDSGLKVIVALREGSSRRRQAEADGFEVRTVAEAADEADVIHNLAPDEMHRDIYESHIRSSLRPGQALGFSHGFSILYNQIVPPPDVDVYMVAPKAPGHVFRRLCREGMGVPGLLAVHQDATGSAHKLALAFARGIGCTRAGVIETTFREETETDLFGEQAVLCGGMTALVKAGFETLVEAGYQPEIAYFECLHELKLIVDLVYEGGLGWMRHSVSDTAQYGDMTRGGHVIGAHARKAMQDILADVQSGAFAREYILENQAGRPAFGALEARESEHMIEAVGGELRAMIPWLRSGDREGGGEG